MPEPIDPAAIPGADILPDVIEDNARTVGTVAGQVSEHGSNVHFRWQGMAGVYEAPESSTLLGLMAPVSSQATQVSDNLSEVSAALIAFAADVRPIVAELASLRTQAEAFGREVDGGVRVREINPAWTAAQSPYGTAAAAPAYQGSWGGSTTAPSTPEQYRYVTKEWHESQDHVDRNNELIAAVNAQQVLLWEAERACANRVRALYGAAPLHAATSEDDALGYGISEIPEGTEMPWGAEVERTEGCGEATANFVVKDFLWEGIAVGGIWGTVQGLGTLVLGYNPETGDFFSGDAYGAAWGNLGMLLFAGAANTGVLAPIFQSDSLLQSLGMDGFLPQEVRDFKAQADEAAINTGKALIAWDKWQDDPGTALGESVFNVGTALIPVGGAAVAGVKTASTAASVVSKMAKVVDFVDPAALAMNGTMRLGGAGLSSLDGLIGRLGPNATDGFHLNTPDMPFVADDATSALQALDDAGVDLGQVSARIDDGVPVYEFPPTDAIPSGRIEMPAGAFDAARGGDVPGGTAGGADATVAAPVREPELVAAGGARGETGPGVVNAIVDDAPVRSGTAGSGEPTVVRDPSTSADSGGPAGGGHDGGGGHGGPGRGGDGAGAAHGDGGSGAGRGDDASDVGRGVDDGGPARGDDTSPASGADGSANGAVDGTDPRAADGGATASPDPADASGSGSSGAATSPLPRPEGPMYSHDASGPGWVRAADTGTVDPIYGSPRPDSGRPDPWYEAAPKDDPEIALLIDDPAAPWGRDADGTPIPSQNDWNSRYALPDAPNGDAGGVRWPTNDGAVAGTRVHYDDVSALLNDYPEFSRLDRIGRWSGDYLTVEGTPFEMRGLTPGHRAMDYFGFDLTPPLPKGVKIEVSVIDEALGYPGGGWQIRFFRSGPSGAPKFLSVDDLIDLEVLG